MKSLMTIFVILSAAILSLNPNSPWGRIYKLFAPASRCSKGCRGCGRCRRR